MKPTDDKGWHLFLEGCLKAKTSSRLNQLLDLLLTIEEKEHLASRMEIIQALLNHQLTQREIADRLKVSISQITRGSNALKILERDFLKFLENLIKN